MANYRFRILLRRSKFCLGNGTYRASRPKFVYSTNEIGILEIAFGGKGVLEGGDKRLLLYLAAGLLFDGS